MTFKFIGCAGVSCSDLVPAPILLGYGEFPGSAGILACWGSGNDRLAEASRQGCLRSQEV